MTDINKEIDETTYLNGCPLNEAIGKYCSPITIQNYQSAINTKKPNSTDTFDKTLMGFLNVTNDAIQNLQRQKENIKNATDILYREIMALIKNGTLIPYSYQLPRNLSDLPMRIPIDIFMAGNINWANSELIYKNFEFTGIRLIEPLKKITEIPIGIINHQNPEKEDKSFKGLPKGTSLKKKQIPSFSNLAPELHIDEKRAAEYLGISPRTLQGYRTKGGGPDFVKISHKVVRYKIADLMKWTENRKRKNTSE